jgi:HSP20 family protein
MLGTFDTFDDLLRRLDTDLATLFGRGGSERSDRDERRFPRMEVLRTDSEFVIRVELPGVDPDSMDVTLDGTVLRVRAERRVPTTEQGEYLRRELVYGTYERVVVLPEGIEPEKMSARFEEGILEVRVPHKAPAAVRVPVEIGSGKQEALRAAS